MTVRVRAVALAATLILLASGAVMLSTAHGSGETENPHWNVAGKRLESGSTKKAKVKTVSEIQLIISGKMSSTEVEVRCKSSSIGSALLEGSAAEHDGKFSGTLEASECKLWKKESKESKEETACEVPAFSSVALKGSLWLAGTKSEAGTTTVMVLEPKEKTEEKNEIAKIEVKGASCSLKNTYLLEGSVAAQGLPQNEEFTYMRWVLPSTAITKAWKPKAEEEEKTIGLKLGGETATMQGEEQAELESVEIFGAGTAPLKGIEAPFWGVLGKRLEGGAEAPLTSGMPKSGTHSTIKGVFQGKEFEIRCTSVKFSEPVLIGSLNQHDGKFKTKGIEFSGCTLWSGGVEQKTCEVPAFSTKALSGRLWFEGPKGSRGTKGVLVLEPETGSVVMEPSIKNKGSETCPFADSPYVVTGSVGFHLSPENEEVETENLTAVSTNKLTVWQSAEQEAERIVELLHEEEVKLCKESKIEKYPVLLETPEIPVTLTGGGKWKFAE